MTAESEREWQAIYEKRGYLVMGSYFMYAPGVVLDDIVWGTSKSMAKVIHGRKVVVLLRTDFEDFVEQSRLLGVEPGPPAINYYRVVAE